MTEIMESEFGFEVVEHPQGFNYLVQFLDESKDLGNSNLVCAWKR